MSKGHSARDDGAAPARSLRDELLERYPSLASIDAADLQRAIAATPTATVARGTVLFREGEPCRGFPFVLDGEIRVARGAPDGRSI